jgi:uncharacterized protein YkwD
MFLSATAEAGAPGHAMIRGFNQVREAHGLRPLRYSQSLAGSSARYSRLQLRRDRFGHSARIMASSRFSRLGEILALVRGDEIRASWTLQSWLSSPGHRQVLLNPVYRYAGAGWAHGLMGESRAVVWTAQFGK